MPAMLAACLDSNLVSARLDGTLGKQFEFYQKCWLHLWAKAMPSPTRGCDTGAAGLRRLTLDQADKLRIDYSAWAGSQGAKLRDSWMARRVHTDEHLAGRQIPQTD